MLASLRKYFSSDGCHSGAVTQEVHMYFLSDGLALQCIKTEKKNKKTKTKSQSPKAKSKSKSAGVTQKVHMYFLSDGVAKNKKQKANSKKQKARARASLKKYICTF